MASNKSTPIVEDLTKLIEATWIDLPLAAAKRVLGGEDQDATRQAGWKAYDAFVRLSNEASNFLYSNRVFGEVTARGIGAALRLHRFGDAAASAIFGNLWPAIGLPTGSEVQALRSDVRALRDELRAVRSGEPPERLDGRHRLPDAEERSTGDRGYAAARGPESRSSATVWNGFIPPAPHQGQRGKNNVAV